MKVWRNVVLKGIDIHCFLVKWWRKSRDGFGEMVFSKEELKGIKFHKEDLVKYVFAVAIILMGVYKVSELN